MKPGDLVWYYDAGNPPVMVTVSYVDPESHRVDLVDEAGFVAAAVQVRDPDHSYCVPVDLNDRDEYVPREKRADGSALPVRTSTQENPWQT